MSTKTDPKGKVGTAATAVETTNGNDKKHVVRSKPSNFGQIGYTVSAELTLSEALDRASEGLLHIAQRAPASRVEKLLVGYTKREEMGEDWTRDMIGYTDELARKFETELAKEIRKVAHIDVTVQAERYEITERDQLMLRPRRDLRPHKARQSSGSEACEKRRLYRQGLDNRQRRVHAGDRKRSAGTQRRNVRLNWNAVLQGSFAPL
jgi:hypothetical protein